MGKSLPPSITIEKRSKKPWLLLLIIPAGFCLYCFFDLWQSQNKLEISEKVVLLSSKTAGQAENWQEFNNQNEGYRLQYPGNWFYRGQSMKVHVISSENVGYPDLSSEGVVVSVSKQTENFMMGGIDWQNATAFFEEYQKRNQGKAYPLGELTIYKYPLTMARNQKWNQYDETEKFALMYLVLKDQALYRLVLDGPKKQAVVSQEPVFDQIVSSLVFLD